MHRNRTLTVFLNKRGTLTITPNHHLKIPPHVKLCFFADIPCMLQITSWHLEGSWSLIVSISGPKTLADKPLLIEN